MRLRLLTTLVLKLVLSRTAVSLTVHSSLKQPLDWDQSHMDLGLERITPFLLLCQQIEQIVAC